MKLHLNQNIALILLLPALFFSCRTQENANILQLSKTQQLMLLDSAKAATAICQDQTDHFFDQVGILDMSIQMKKAYPENISREKILPEYLQFLQQDVSNFSTEESTFVREVFTEVFANCESLTKGMFPTQIRLIKTKGKHYGDGVYYTRENCIVIPADALKKRNRQVFTETMYHELFHVYSRLNPKKRAELYALIGFHYLPEGKLQMSDSLRSRILLNPDGVNYKVGIAIQKSDGSSINAIPIIYSGLSSFRAEKPGFFNYLQFNLFQVETLKDQSMKVLTKSDGSSVLQMETLSNYFEQIKDNTEYIIHPDEIMADNFAIVMQLHKNPDTTRKYSKEGLALLANVQSVLTK